MCDSLIEGKRYKVRLKPREELVKVVEEEHFFRETWFKDYMDGQVGVLQCDSVATADAVYEVLWEDTYWYYKLEWLKVLGEVD